MIYNTFFDTRPPLYLFTLPYPFILLLTQGLGDFGRPPLTRRSHVGYCRRRVPIPGSLLTNFLTRGHVSCATFQRKNTQIDSIINRRYGERAAQEMMKERRTAVGSTLLLLPEYSWHVYRTYIIFNFSCSTVWIIAFNENFRLRWPRLSLFLPNPTEAVLGKETDSVRIFTSY